MRFSRHAKNQMRLYGISRDQVVDLVASPNRHGVEGRGNVVYSGAAGGMRIKAVLAGDDMETIITVYDLES